MPSELLHEAFTTLRHRLAQLEPPASQPLELSLDRFEQALIKSQRKLSFLAQHSSLGVIEWNKAFEVTSWNPGAQRIFGYSSEEAIGLHAAMLIPDHAKAEVEPILRSLLEHPTSSHDISDNVRKDGAIITCEWDDTPIADLNGETVGVYSIVQDISETKRLKAQQQQSEARFRLFVESSNDVFFSFSPDGIFSYLSPRFADVFGFDPAKFLGTSFALLMHPEDLEHSLTVVQQIVATGEKYPEFEARVKHKDGGWLWVAISNAPLKDLNGETIGIHGVVRDITEAKRDEVFRKQAEEALRQSEAQYRSIFEAVSDGIFINDLETGALVEVNPATCRMHGYSYEQFMNLPPGAFVHPDYQPLFKQYLETTRAGKPFYCQSVGVRKDGSPFDLEVKATLCTYNGKPHSIAMVRDISQAKRDEAIRQQAETAIRESEARFRMINRCMPGVVYEYSYNLKTGQDCFNYISPKCLELLEIEPIALLETAASLWAIMHPDDVPQIVVSVDRAVQTRTLWTHEFRVITASGQEKWIYGQSEPTQDQNGDVSLHYGLFVDITQQKRAEAELAKQQQTLRAIVDNAPIWIWMLDANGRMQFVNKTFCENVGISEDQLLAVNHYSEVLGTEATVNCIASDAACLAQSLPHYSEEVFPFVDGQLHSLEITKVKVEDAERNPMGLVGLAIDATERKQSEAELQRTQKFLKSVLESLPVMVLAKEAKSLQFVLWNHAAETLTGFSAAELLGKNDHDFFPPEQAEFFMQNDRAVLNSGEVLDTPEEQVQTKSGETRIFHTKKSAISDDEGKPLYLLAIAEDITEAKQRETELRKSQELLRLVIDTIPQLIAWKDRNSGYLGCNQKFAEVAGFNSPDELIGKTDYDLAWKTEEADFFRACDRRIMESDTPELHIIEPLRQADGKEAWLDTCKLPLHDPEGNVVGISVMIDDITNRKQAEEALRRSEAQLRQQAQDLEQTLRELKRTQSQLVQSEKMSSLGQLVAGVAHEINNPVNFIYGNLSHANEYTKDLLNLLKLYQTCYPNPAPEVQAEAEAIDLDFLMTDLPKLLASMKVGADRIRQIVTSLRVFSRMDESEFKSVDIHEGIDSTLMILQNRIKVKHDRPAVEIIKAYGKLPLIECYAGQLNQVFMNIISNALDAVEERDDKRSTEQRKQNPGAIYIHTECVNGRAIVRIRDNGSGMSETVRQRLFDPFYTTKPVGKGTGMGLSISYQIVAERHGGTLDCISSPGQGAEFAIAIPVWQAVSG